MRQRRWLKEVKQADYNASLKYMQVVMEKAEGTKFYEKIKDKFLYIKLEQKERISVRRQGSKDDISDRLCIWRK